MFNEVIIILCFIAMGALAGVHISYGKYTKNNDLKFSWIRHTVTIALFFVVAFVLREVNNKVNSDSGIHYFAILLGIVTVYVTYKVKSKVSSE